MWWTNSDLGLTFKKIQEDVAVSFLEHAIIFFLWTCIVFMFFNNKNFVLM